METFYKPLTMGSTSCYLFVVLLVIAVAGVPLQEEPPAAVQLPIHRHVHSVPVDHHRQTRNRIRHLKNRLFTNAASGKPLARNFTDSGPFGDDYTFADEILTIDITLGTPPRKYNVTLDYGWGFAFFFDAGNTQSPCVIGPDMPTRRWYNPKSSTSAKPGLQLPYGIGLEEAPYIPNGCYTGPEKMEDTVAMWTDNMTIGSLTSRIPLLQMTDARGVLNYYWPSDGILGAAIDLGTDPFFQVPSNQKYAIYQLTSQLPKNATTVHINRNADRSYRLDGTFTIGGIDNQNCDTKWNYVPPSKLYGYVDSAIEVKFSYGKYRDSKHYNAYLTATSAYLTTPPNIIDYIVEATGAEYDFLLDQYTLPCSNDVSKLPDMVFEMVTGFQYHLPASDYIRQLPGNPSNLCTLMLTDGNYQSPQFTLGTTFSRPYCVLFDYDKKQVAFAKNIH